MSEEERYLLIYEAKQMIEVLEKFIEEETVKLQNEIINDI